MKQRDVERLIKKNGFGVKRHDFGTVNEGKITCGCALTHLYCDSHTKQPINKDTLDDSVDYNRILKWANKTYGETFANAVMAGLDGNGQEEFANKKLQAKHNDGYKLGRQFRKAYNDSIVSC